LGYSLILAFYGLTTSKLNNYLRLNYTAMYDETYKKLGLSIKKYRRLRGLTQEKLAESIDVSLDFMGKIEIAYSKPSFKTVIAIANALDISLKDLFDFED